MTSKWKRRYKAYLQTDHWDRLRSIVLGRDGEQCVRCGSRELVHAHHKLYRDRFEDSIPEDLETLCQKCHAKHHFISKISKTWEQHVSDIEALGLPLSQPSITILRDLKRFAPKTSESQNLRARANRLLNSLRPSVIGKDGSHGRQDLGPAMASNKLNRTTISDPVATVAAPSLPTPAQPTARLVPHSPGQSRPPCPPSRPASLSAAETTALQAKSLDGADSRWSASTASLPSQPT